MIYTSSTIDIYKIFKGNLTCGTIEVITRGGCVGDECLYITDNLILKKDMLGVFMCNQTSKELPVTDFFPETNILKLDLPYEIQGYIKYFEDNFNKQIVDYQYSLDSLAQVYNLMELYTQLNYIDCHGSLISENISQQKTKTIRDPNQEAKEFLSGISIERAQNDTILNYTLMNPQITGTGTKFFEFDIGLSDNTDVLYFTGGYPKFHFDSLAYGAMVMLNNKIWVTNIGPLTDTVNSYFPVSATDIQRDNFGLYIAGKNPNSFPTNFISLSSIPTPCIHVKIQVLDCSRSGYINQILGPFPYYFPRYSLNQSTGPSHPYNDFDITTNVYSPGCGSVQISSIRPDTVSGGVRDTVTIRGLNFGSRGTDSKIFVKNADDGGLTYITLNYLDIFDWNDIIIKFVMPGIIDSLTTPNVSEGIPGSGPMKIQTNTLDSVTGYIKVFYSLLSVTDSLSSLHKVNATPYDASPNGTREGIVFYYDSSFYNHPERMMCTNRAMKDWTCMSQINFSVRGNLIDTSGAARDSFNFIRFGPTNPGKLAETLQWVNTTPGCTKPLWRIDMVFKDSMAPYLFCDTNTCDSLPHNLIDLYAVALHEFGHAHGINHINDRNAIMWYGTRPGINPYTVSSDRQIWINYYQSAYAASLKVVSNSLDPNIQTCLGGGKTFTPLVLSDCEFTHRQTNSQSDCHFVIGIDEVEFASSFILYPNPANNKISVELREDANQNITIQICDLRGRSVIEPSLIKKGNQFIEIDVSDLPVGIYLLKFSSTNSVISKLFLKN